MQISLLLGAARFTICGIQRRQNAPYRASAPCGLTPRQHAVATRFRGLDLSMKHRELGLIEGFFLCLRDSRAVRRQTSQWKRSLLLFSSGVCLEISALPLVAELLNHAAGWQLWLLTVVFVPLGVLGLYASKFGDDRLVERLLVVPELDLRI
jgi:hypothetical protein